MTLLLPFVLGLLWHTLWAWVGIGEAWVSLLLAVLAVSLLAGLEAFVRALAWEWIYTRAGTGLGAVQWLRRFLPGSGRGDGSDVVAAAWADAEPVLWVVIAVAGWGIAQFVVEMTDDVVGKIALLAVALVLLGLDVLTGACGGGDSDGGGGGGGMVATTAGAAARAVRAAEDAAAARHLTASMPLPPALGGGSGKGNDRLTFKLDL